VGAAKWSVAIASVVFVLAAGMLNPLCLWLSPIALGWVLGYSYTKRFTRYAHLWLGIGLSIAPSAGWLAVSGAWPMPGWFLPLLSLGVAAWTGGFDVLYALPDAEFDRTNGLWSIPSTIGVPKALLVARLLHVVSVLAFVVVGHTLGLIVPGFTGIATTLWWAGLAAVALLLLYEHTLVSADDLSKLDAAFFTMNGIISLTFFGFVLAARLVAGSW
jgi:4-hydroxybenzoate polyprenyltransferase